MPATSNQWLVFPSDRYPPYSGWHVLQFLQSQLQDSHRSTAISFIGFSAGAMAAITAAHGWQCQGGQVQRVIALDGWGVPLWGNFPMYRLSHDAFTHWSSALLGQGEANFYADPSVSHLELWRSPHTIHGWQTSPNSCTQPTRTTAAQFIARQLGKGGRWKAEKIGVRIQETGDRRWETEDGRQETEGDEGFRF